MRLLNLELLCKRVMSPLYKKLEILCSVKGKKHYIKGFGLIKNIPNKKLKDIYEFTILIKLSKQISEVSYYASRHHRIDNTIFEITEDD